MSRSELMKLLWPRKTVEDTNLDHRKSEANRILEPLALEIVADNRGVWKLVELR